MSEDGTVRFERAMLDYLQAKVTRARMLKATGAGFAVAMLPHVAGAQTSSESVQDIINVADTAEHLAITLLNGAINSTALALTGLNLAIIKAALAEEQYHADFLEGAGAKTATDTFTVPDPKILTDQPTFFNTLVTLETAFVAAYMAAVREFTGLGHPELAKYAYEIGGVEAEHRTLARTALAMAGQTSDSPPNNKAFETNMFMTVGQAATALGTLGFIGGTGAQVTYPGRATALSTAGVQATAVMNQVPQNISVPTAAHALMPPASRSRGLARNVPRAE